MCIWEEMEDKFRPSGQEIKVIECRS
jgi:hypothetical protein